MNMSDITEERYIWGNFNRQSHPERQGDKNIYRQTSRRPLVEEAVSIDMGELRRIYGREKLLKFANEGKPFTVQLADHSFYSIYMCWEPHRLPGRTENWSDIAEGNCRLYFICPCCYRKIRILYKNPQALLSDLPSIGCKRCLHLVYASENSCKNKWWKEIVRPLRRLYRRRKKLLTRIWTPQVAEELQRTEELIIIYTERAKLKNEKRSRSEKKRQYKNVNLVLGLSRN
jgi:hypothetical protein